MFTQYMEELHQLQSTMLDELHKLSTVNDIEHESAREVATVKHDNTILVECTRLIVEFESLIKVTVIALNQSNRGIKLRYIGSKTLDSADSLKISGDLAVLNYDVKQIIERLIVFINWSYEFKRNVRITTKSNYFDKFSKIDQLRNDSINAHIRKTSKVAPKDTGSVDVQGLSTKAQLLYQTKKLTKNLIKGNQILQSGILQSDLNLDEVRQQTNSLQKLDDKYDQFQTVFNKTSSLVKSLEKASNNEKRDVYFALFFLIACISWIIWRRILKLPVKLLLWMCFKFFKSILMAIGLIQSTISTTTTTPDISSATTTNIVKQTVQSIEHAVEEAVDRILSSHDEL